ncbi:MAG: hypothetical protein ACO2XZ_01440 [Rickettsiales bacterium]
MKISISLKLYTILFFLTACNSNYTKNDVAEQPIEEKTELFYRTEAVGDNLRSIFGASLTPDSLVEYNKYIQNILEKEYDGKDFTFISSDKTLTSKLKLKDSFKIVEYDVYCREYVQDVEHMSDNLSFSSVSCRGNAGLWHNLARNN